MRILLNLSLLFALTACSAGMEKVIMPAVSGSSSTTKTAQSITRHHFLYAGVECSSSPIRGCIDTFEYNSANHTLHLLRRLVIPANTQSFAIDNEGDIVVGVKNGVFYYHHDDAGFARPFKSLYTRTTGSIAISARDTLFVSGPGGSDATQTQLITGYEHASDLTALTIPNIRHSCVFDSVNQFIDGCFGQLAADAADNVYEVIDCTPFGYQCIIGWTPSDTQQPLYNPGTPCSGYQFQCTEQVNSVSFDINNYLVETRNFQLGNGLGATSVGASIALSRPTVSEPAIDVTAADYEVSNSPLYASTDDGVNTVFVAQNDSETSGVVEIAMYDFKGRFLGEYAPLAAGQLIYK